MFYCRKSSGDEEVISLSKTLIKTWKKFVPESAEKKEAKAKIKEEAKKIENGKEAKQKEDLKSFPSRPQVRKLSIKRPLT